MTREELQKVRDAALAGVAKSQPTSATDDVLEARAWMALAQAADHLDAMLARDETRLETVEDADDGGEPGEEGEVEEETTFDNSDGTEGSK